MKKTNISYLIAAALFLFVTSCKNNSSGEKAQVGEAQQVAAANGDKYVVDAKSAKLLWEASKVTGTHNGSVNIGAGEFFLKDGNITSGSFTIAMNSIMVYDLQSGQGKEDLESHLKGTGAEGVDDFFNINAFPTAKYEITKTTALSGDSTATHLIYGNLTLKGITKEVGFKAKITNQGNMIKVSAPQFQIDRTEFGIKFRSGKFFDNLADKAINDNFGLAVELTAIKN
jgi:polyisoprenoid-binding protein YceI